MQGLILVRFIRNHYRLWHATSQLISYVTPTTCVFYHNIQEVLRGVYKGDKIKTGLWAGKASSVIICYMYISNYMVTLIHSGSPNSSINNLNSSERSQLVYR